MKLELVGIIEEAFGIQPTKNGFQQNVILKQPAAKDEFERTTGKDQFYRISIWSNAQTDSRFVQQNQRGTKKKCRVYLNGERWQERNTGDYTYMNKLALIEWMPS